MFKFNRIIASSAIFGCLCIAGTPFNVWAVDITPPPTTIRTLNVDTVFDKTRFYDKQILEFSFVKGDWVLDDFDFTKHAFAPITDVLQLKTNVPKADISAETYTLSMVKNSSQCLTYGGGVGSANFVTVSVDGKKVTGIGTSIDGGGFTFQGADRTGLYANHKVTLTFDKIVMGVDRVCKGTVGMTVELDI
ncbi:hypothetical protein [Photobacterium indicum]|uniref:hypothetical protein n=1 Tax=Photobacterium indicum TaxID=81447 RepID=UPI003D0AE065